MKKISLNLPNLFFVLLVTLAVLAVYFTFVSPIRFSHLIKREGITRYAEVKILLPEDLGWLGNVIPTGEESRNVYGALDWKILGLGEELIGDKRIVKVTAKVSVVDESSGILRYGKYTLVTGSRIFLINDRYVIEGRVFKSRVLKETVPI